MPPFEAEYYVYFYEVDRSDVVHYSYFFLYVDRAEEDFLRARGLLDLKPRLPRVEAHIRYYRPLRRGDKVKVRLKLDEVRRRAIRYAFEIINATNGVKSAEGYVVVACAEKSDGAFQLAECPAEFIEIWHSTLS